MLHRITLFCLIFLSISPLWAQVSDSIVSLNQEAQTYQLDTPIEITGYRYWVDPTTRPVASSIFGAQELAQLNPRSTPEALMGTTGVWMQKTNHGGGSPFLRGLTGNQTLLLIDGIRLNNSTYRYGPNQYLNTVDPLSIQQMEIIRGSGSVQYGSDALGGAIQILSREAAYLADSGWAVNGNLYGKYMTQEMELASRAEIALRSANFTLLVGANYKDYGDLVAGEGLGTQAPSAYIERDYDIKAKWKPAPNQEITLARQFVRQEEVGRYDQVAQRGYEFYRFDPQERTLNYARWSIRGNHPAFSKLSVTLSHQHSLEGREKKRVDSDIQTFEEDQVTVWGASLELHSQLAQNWAMVSGIEGYFDEVGSFEEATDLTTNTLTRQRGLYPDGATQTNLAIFSLHTLTLANWTLNAGLRYNTIRLETEDEQFGNVNINPGALVGNLSANYTLSPSQSIWIAAHTGFRAPNINDISSFGSFDSGIEVPSSQLSPERTLSLDLGYTLNSPRVRAQANVYYTRLFDLITRSPATFQGSPTYQGEAVFQKINSAEAFIYGAEGEMRISLGKQGEAYTNFTYTFGEDISKEEPLRRIPPFFGRTGVRWEIGKAWLRLEGLYAGKQDRLSGGDINDHRIAAGGTPGWMVANLYVGFSLGNLRLTGSFQNMGNTAYRMHGSGVDGYGRSGWLALNWQW